MHVVERDRDQVRPRVPRSECELVGAVAAVVDVRLDRRRAALAAGDGARERIAAEAARVAKIVASLDQERVGHTGGADGQCRVGRDRAATHTLGRVRAPPGDDERGG